MQGTTVFAKWLLQYKFSPVVTDMPTVWWVSHVHMEMEWLTSHRWLSRLGKWITKIASLFLPSHFNNGSMPPFIGSPPLHLLSLNFHNLLCTSHSSPLSSGSNQGFRSNANVSGATTASTKTFLTALVLNSIIATVEISVFTLVRRYFRLIYEPRSLSVFESCACTFVLW